MATRRMNHYAKAYSFGADGNALSVGPSIAGKRTKVLQRPARARNGLRLPVWVAVLAVAGVVFVQSFVLLGIRSETTKGQKRINTLRAELSKVHEEIGALEIELAKANEPSRIHSIAVNRLGMQLPTAEQIYTIPRPNIPSQTQAVAAQREGGGFFRLVLSLLGL